MTTAFVTGGSGFVGRRLIGVLQARGDTVLALARSDAAGDRVRAAGAEPVRGDLDDELALRRGMAGANVVFHLAADTRQWGSDADAYRTNVAGTEHVLAAARAAAVPRLVYLSTEAVLIGAGSPTLKNADETWPRARHPFGQYNRTKALAEERVVAASSPDFETVVVRARLIWGEDDTSLWLPQLAEAVRSGSFRWIGGGRQLTSTSNVANVCEGLVLAAERGRGGEIYFVTDGAPVEFRSFITALLRTQAIEAGEGGVPRWLARALAGFGELTWRVFNRKGSPPLTRALVHTLGDEVTVNDAKARRELGYVGAISRQAGLAAMARPDRQLSEEAATMSGTRPEPAAVGPGDQLAAGTGASPTD